VIYRKAVVADEENSKDGEMSTSASCGCSIPAHDLTTVA